MFVYVPYTEYSDNPSVHQSVRFLGLLTDCNLQTHKTILLFDVERANINLLLKNPFPIERVRAGALNFVSCLILTS